MCVGGVNLKNIITAIVCSSIIGMAILISVKYYADSNIYEIAPNTTILLNKQTGETFIYKEDTVKPDNSRWQKLKSELQ